MHFCNYTVVFVYIILEFSVSWICDHHFSSWFEPNPVGTGR